jgi:hypothetical protein
VPLCNNLLMALRNRMASHLVVELTTWMKMMKQLRIMELCYYLENQGLGQCFEMMSSSHHC